MKEQKLQEERRRARRSLLRVVTRVFVCVILCLAVLTPIALASIPALRERVAKLFINIKDDHMEISLSKYGNDLIPEGWNGAYYPSYIPERYRFFGMSRLSVCATFVDESNARLLYYNEDDENTNISIDSENADIYYKNIGAYNVLVLEKEDHTTFVWNNEDTLFMISGYITFDEAKQIMDSLVKV